MEKHFDIDKVVSIDFYPVRIQNWIWQDEIPEKRIFFGLINLRGAISPGFRDLGDWGDRRRYTQKEVEEYGYKVYPYEERINNRVCSKPCVSLNLISDIKIQKTFETEEEASHWIEELKLKSGKSFEIIKK